MLHMSLRAYLQVLQFWIPPHEWGAPLGPSDGEAFPGFGAIMSELLFSLARTHTRHKNPSAAKLYYILMRKTKKPQKGAA